MGRGGDPSAHGTVCPRRRGNEVEEAVKAMMNLDLSAKQFKSICRLVHAASGIRLKHGKEALVRARLMKRLRALQIDSIADYMNLIESDVGAPELSALIDVMTTNKTGFFREAEHFSYLSQTVLPDFSGNRLRLWSAACSSGEEAYSLAMLLHESPMPLDDKDILILATDISRRMLEKARAAVYDEPALRTLPSSNYRKYFVKLRNGDPGRWQVVTEVRRLVRLAWLNLQEPWPMKGRFDVIFCRNVMMYFNRESQQQMVERFWNLLAPGGHLFVGHSEGLSGVKHRFEYLRPAIYRK